MSERTVPHQHTASSAHHAKGAACAAVPDTRDIAPPDAGTGEAFALTVPPTLPLPVLIAVPHAGRCYADALLAAMRDPAWGPARLEDRFVDRLGETVAEATGAALMIAHAPRAMIDLNRAPDDIDWSMISGASGARDSAPGSSVSGGARRTVHSAANRRARTGLGLVPRRLAGLGELWRGRLPLEELHARIAGVHRPYHRAVAATLDRLRDRWGAALLIDLHSMPPLRQAGDAGESAEFVIGDRFGASCTSELSALALRQLAGAGRRVAHNRPYSGGYALDHHAAPRRGIHAIQIEVCRSAYLDAQLDQPGPRLPAVARALAGTVRALAREVASIGDPRASRQAAE